MTGLIPMLVLAGVSLLGLAVIGLLWAHLYKKASSEQAFVRTGAGKRKVIMEGGAVCIPFLHNITMVNMKTTRLVVAKAGKQSLITLDRMRVDCAVDFYVRVAPNENAIATAATTLGSKTDDPLALKEMLESKALDALRATAATSTMKDLHEKRAEFVQQVQSIVSQELQTNGLMLESVSLTSLDQTPKEHFDPNSAFDAEGLARLTEEIEGRRMFINRVERDTEVAIARKDLEARQFTLAIAKDAEQARLAQEQEIAALHAAQVAEVARTNADGARLSEQAQIASRQQIAETRIKSERLIGEAEAEKRKAVETAEITARTAVELATQEKSIALADKSRAESEAKARADAALAEAVAAEEGVETVRQTAQAERAKSIEVIRAKQDAEKQAVGVIVAADAERSAAGARAAALLIEAEAGAEAATHDASAILARKSAEARGIREITEAENLLSPEQVALRIKTALIAALPEIIAQSVKPLENIDSIRIADVSGLSGAVARGSGSGGNASGDRNLADAVVSSALRHRAMAPLVDGLLADVGLDMKSLSGMANSVAGVAGIGGAAVQATASLDVPAGPLPHHAGGGFLSASRQLHEAPPAATPGE